MRKNQNMPLEIIEHSSKVPCHTYNCRNRIAYAIGRSKKVTMASNCYCQDCMNDIGTAMPPETLLRNPYVVELIANAKTAVSDEALKLTDEITQLKGEILELEEKNSQLTTDNAVLQDKLNEMLKKAMSLDSEEAPVQETAAKNTTQKGTKPAGGGKSNVKKRR